MSKKSVIVASPTLSGNNVIGAYHISIVNLEKACKEKGINMVNAHATNETFPHKSRNALCRVFMESQDHTHLLFIDPDIEFNADDIIKMIEFDQPVVGGMNYKTKIRWDKITDLVNQKGSKNYSLEDVKMISREYNFIPKNDDMNTVDLTQDFIEVNAVGTGVLLIKKEALKKIQDSYPKDKYLDEDNFVFRFFDNGLKLNAAANVNIYMGDDMFFCNRWRELGGKVYLYTKFRCQHWGTYPF